MPCRKKREPLRFISCLCLFYSSFAWAEYDPSSDLLSAFGGTCSNQTDLSQKAQGQAETLTNIAQALRDDRDCGGISVSLNTGLRAVSWTVG